MILVKFCIGNYYFGKISSTRSRARSLRYFHSHSHSILRRRLYLTHKENFPLHYPVSFIQCICRRRLSAKERERFEKKIKQKHQSVGFCNHFLVQIKILLISFLFRYLFIFFLILLFNIIQISYTFINCKSTSSALLFLV
jgi:hypothetical protein